MAPNDSGSAAIFLDRDGTLMREVNYCADPKQVEIFPGVPEALVRLEKAGYKLIVISNQAGIGRGYFTEAQYRLVEAEVARAVLPATFEAVYFCPDHPDHATDRRKPAPGMVLEAQRDHGIDLARSFFIGDKAIDIACGRNSGLRTILVRTGYGAEEQDEAGANWVTDDLAGAVDIIVSLNEARRGNSG
ncbi:MAG: HAD family hydrolase [Spartobacteria bacterium]